MSQDSLIRLFTLLDGNRSGGIDRADLESFGAKAGGRATDKAAALWKALSALDADSDGVVTKDEFIAGADYDTVFESTVALHMTLFDSADTDNDNKISRAEWGSINATLGISDTDAEANFNAVDSDRDGLVTRNEFLERVTTLIQGNSDLAAVDVTRPPART
ncbi:EF-hand domain-containing protein [Umezawaea endophytica]|uniref:EF-hand domain-containing protein n=1 Tax=Umezawaea endophytica TaxID=1654476 RepID=A0A9X2VV92_9PSEU|nr:EF-hand domain-containing protein [Umezawaea endophytica]MCS7483319.1 EF-hand domain-containing protein [Umezawaea endophytica]